jgi:hypothetical protein
MYVPTCACIRPVCVPARRGFPFRSSDPRTNSGTCGRTYGGAPASATRCSMYNAHPSECAPTRTLINKGQLKAVSYFSPRSRPTCRLGCISPREMDIRRTVVHPLLDMQRSVTNMLPMGLARCAVRDINWQSMPEVHAEGVKETNQRYVKDRHMYKYNYNRQSPLGRVSCMNSAARCVCWKLCIVISNRIEAHHAPGLLQFNQRCNFKPCTWVQIKSDCTTLGFEREAEIWKLLTSSCKLPILMV